MRSVVQDIGDVDAAQGTFDGVLAALGIVAGVGAVDGHGTEPEAGSDDFGGDAAVVEFLLELAGLPCGAAASDLSSMSGTASSS
jgi:hypothetical protein